METPKEGGQKDKGIMPNLKGHIEELDSLQRIMGGS
jgi:hypothetical protein